MQDVKPQLLITTAIEQSWGSNGDRIFLGEWCKAYSRKEVWQTFDAPSIDYHWRDRAKLERDSDRIGALYEQILGEIASFLNKFHNLNRDAEYWRLIIGPWLLTYLPVLWDRWEMVSNIPSSEYPLETIILNKGEPREVPEDFHKAAVLFDSDYWNHKIFAAIISYQNHPDITCKCMQTDISRGTAAAPNPSLLNRVKHYVADTSDKIFEFLSNSKPKVIFVHSYFPRLTLFRIALKLGQWPRSYRQFNKVIDPCEAMDRSEVQANFMAHLTSQPGATFETFIRVNTFLDIPICYLEGFQAIYEWQKKIPMPDQVFTANAHFGNEVFKVWAAEGKLSGTDLIISSHGGAIYPLYSVFDHQEKVANYRIVWGKPWISGQIRMPANKLNIKMRKYRVKGDISLIDFDGKKFSYRCVALPMGPLTMEVYNQNKKLIDVSSQRVKQFLKVRPCPHGKWEKKQRYIDDFGPDILSKQSSLADTLINSRLIICCYPQTTFAEAMFSGVPTVMLYLEEYWEVQPIYTELIQCLKRVGIIHTDTFSASEHIESIFDDPMRWWNDSETVLARQMFDEMCLTIKSDSVDVWASFFKSLSEGSVN